MAGGSYSLRPERRRTRPTVTAPKAWKVSSQAELEMAMGIACSDYDKPPPEIPGVDRFGALCLFEEDERRQLVAMHDLIRQYIARNKPRRPLSLAVFGPPGSGKSFAVEQIMNELKLKLTNINLTQVSEAAALGEVLSRAAKSADGKTPVIFFDEFDAPRDGAAYGWLAWFLAPMQDGNFLHNGNIIELKRAVYVFAGGTASSMRQFSDLDRLPEFRRAKGPDFISRVRGFLDVCGPNTKPRMLRRAILFRSELSRAVGKKSAAQFKPTPELMTSLLQAGRYRHGARSIAALVDLSHLENKDRFGWDDLPEDHLLGLHVDRGPLDRSVLGGSIAFSGYDEKAEVADLWCEVARKLWSNGATLSYAGRWAEGARGWLIRLLEDELRERPPEPSRTKERRTKPTPWLESFLDDVEREHKLIDAALPITDRDRMGVKVTFAAHLTEEERKEPDPWLRSGLEHFRRRLAVSDTSVARFAVVGARSDYYGRFPGIPEEVMLTLAQGKPIYVAGAFGGAAADVGSILGLAHPRRGDLPSSLRAEPREAEGKLAQIADKLRPGPWTDLPVTASELVAFLKAHALGGSKWPNNGLTFDENRCLFASKDQYEIADLVLAGLLRLFSE